MNGPDHPLRRGQLPWVVWDPGRGSEQQGRRPAVIVQADPINRSQRYTNTIVVAVSMAAHDVPTHVAVDPSPNNRLQKRSYVLCEQLLTISRERRGAHWHTRSDGYGPR